MYLDEQWLRINLAVLVKVRELEMLLFIYLFFNNYKNIFTFVAFYFY